MSSDASRGGPPADISPATAPTPLLDPPQTAGEAPASDRAELLRRRLEVRALRQAVELERSRRQQVVDRYESLLNERTAEATTSDEPAGLRGLVDDLRRRLTPRPRRA